MAQMDNQEGDNMIKSFQKVTVYAADMKEGDAIAKVANSIPNIKTVQREASLTAANGTAHAVAFAGEIILFRTEGVSETDLEAARQLCLRAGAKARVIAISDDDLPLSAARKLLNVGVADVLPASVDRDELQQCLARLSIDRIEQTKAASRGKIITVAQARGGIGSTTIAVNLADALRGESGMFRKKTESRVVVVDLDLQFGAVASFLDVAANEALCQMATDGTVPDGTFLLQALVESKSGLSVLAAPHEFVPLETLSGPQIEALLDQLSQHFDYVVVDLPRTLVHWVQVVLNKSDQVFLVTDTSVPAIRQSKRIIDAYLEENPTLQIDVIVNYEAKPLIKGRHHVEAAKLLERDLRYWLPNDPKIAREALDRGVTLSNTARRSRLNKAIKIIASDFRASASHVEKTAPISSGHLMIKSVKLKDGGCDV